MKLLRRTPPGRSRFVTEGCASGELPNEGGHEGNCRGESYAIGDVHLTRALRVGFKIHSAAVLLKKHLMKAVRCRRSNWPITCSVMRNPMVATAPRAKPIQNMQRPHVLTHASVSLGRSRRGLKTSRRIVVYRSLLRRAGL